ncbi:MAG TPA: CsgG/HfaB family protein [Vicinamibacterales bacterium]|nr:CsgG/HfaB family protein [Vicinamibacterales bacterium]
MDFEVAPGGWTLPPPQVGATAADLLLDQLVNAAPYRVLDGRWLQPEGALQNRGRGFERLRDAAQASGVDYLVLGSVTRFSAETTRRNPGGGGFGAPLIGGYGRQTNELVVSLSARVVDVRSGEVVTTGIGDGKSRRRRLAIGALGFFRLPGAAALSSGATASRDAQLDEALRQAVAATAKSLIAAAPRLAR